VILVYKLNSIWKSVTADLFLLEQVNGRDVSRDVELPVTLHLVFRAVDRLVSQSKVQIANYEYYKS